MASDSLYVCKGGIADMEKETGREDKRRLFAELRARGFSLRRVAKKLHISVQTASNWHHDMEEEIARLKAAEIEALHEEYFLAKESRIRLLGGQLKALHKELERRDLSEIPTARLLELQLTYYKELLAEYVEPRILSESQAEEIRRLRAELEGPGGRTE